MTAPDGSKSGAGGRGPLADGRADYDYRDGTDPARSLVPTDDDGETENGDLAAAIDARVDGAVRFDRYSRSLYATDASAYEVTPVGLVLPESTEDVAAVVEVCADHGVAVLPRGGGTSLAGQAVNEAVVLDFTRHMDDVVAIDPETRTATAQPGAVLGELNADCAEHDLKFAPDPAWADKSALGGAIGNNSTGAHSLVYGKTDAYLRSCEVVLADGTVTRLGETPLSEVRERADPDGDPLARIYAAVAEIIDEADTVRDAYPNLKRNVSGYNLDVIVEQATGGDPFPAVETPGAGGTTDGAEPTVNLAQLLAGSEGTLAVVTEATVALEPVPETEAVALLSYDDLVEAMEDLTAILAHDPAALEVMDDVLLDLARDTREFADLVGMLPEGTESVLLVEFYADTDAGGHEKVRRLLADRCPAALTVDEGGVAGDSDGHDPGEDDAPTDEPRRAVAAMEAHDDGERERFWKLRKSGLPILLSRTTDEKHISFIEDTAVPPASLPEYVQEFRRVLDEHDTYASFYAHAGPGVLHVRPLINTKSDEGVERMESIAERVTDLVAEYGGSVSGEHGDGRARTGWNRKLYGDRVHALFRGLKRAFDPQGILNPGQVCGDVSMTANLRFDPEYDFDAGFEPALDWGADGFQGAVELCHGCGGCRGAQETAGGVMCPTYRAVDEEGLSTRGRANALRQAMSGDLALDQFDEEFKREVLDLCIGCKGCLRNCPSGVDLARMKAEVTHARHQQSGASLRDRLFARVHELLRVGSLLSPVSDLVTRLPGAGRLQEVVGVASERDPPPFARESLRDWFDGRGSRVTHESATRRAVLFPDTYGTYSEPRVGRAAVRVLETADVRVRIPETTGSGRPPYSKGFLDLARRRAEHNVEVLAPLVDQGWDVVVAEPSDAVMLQDEYRDLRPGDDTDLVADNTYGLSEYLDRFGLLDDAAVGGESQPARQAAATDGGTAGAGGRSRERLVYHGHCQQTALKRAGHAPAVLAGLGYDVATPDTGCCGMAGAFGYEAEHVSMSRAIGDVLFDQLRDVDPTGEARVVAPGSSCRTQIDDLSEWARPLHPAEAIAEALEVDP